MSTEIKVALIASITSLVIAIISVITVFLNHRMLKKEKKLIIKNDNFKKNIEAIDNVNIGIQILKDTILYIVSGFFSDKENVLKKIISDTNNIVKCYENGFISLDIDEKEITHDIKNKIIEYSSSLKERIYDIEDVNNINHETKEYLFWLKDNYTVTQDMLLKLKRKKMAVLY